MLTLRVENHYLAKTWSFDTASQPLASTLRAFGAPIQMVFQIKSLTAVDAS
jgi:hypothetical protein